MSVLVDISLRYNIMRHCWRDRPHDRPTFDQLYTVLSHLVMAKQERQVYTLHFDKWKPEGYKRWECVHAEMC